MTDEERKIQRFLDVDAPIIRARLRKLGVLAEEIRAAEAKIAVEKFLESIRG